jgi:hypothetical protein
LRWGNAHPIDFLTNRKGRMSVSQPTGRLKARCQSAIIAKVSSGDFSRRTVCGGNCVPLSSCVTAPQDSLSAYQQEIDPYVSIYGPFALNISRQRRTKTSPTPRHDMRFRIFCLVTLS